MVLLGLGLGGWEVLGGLSPQTTGSVVFGLLLQGAMLVFEKGNGEYIPFI